MHHLIISIHLSIFLTTYPVYNHRGTEACPSCHRVRGGEHLGQVANLLLGSERQTITHPHIHNNSQIRVTSLVNVHVSWLRGSRRNRTGTKDANSTQKHPILCSNPLVIYQNVGCNLFLSLINCLNFIKQHMTAKITTVKDRKSLSATPAASDKTSVFDENM